jgi:hypothetical protein
MTREEAIQAFEAMKSEENYNALIGLCNMAIEALTYQNLSKPNNTCEDDLIRRRDAIEAVVCHIWHMPNEAYRQFNCENIVREVVEDAIQRLPSADAVEVVRCKDCKHRRDICSMRYIEMVGEDERIHDYSTDNGYCSWGERREDGEA